MDSDVVLIPLWDRKRDIVGFTQVDAADVHLVIFDTWHLGTDGYARHGRAVNGRCKMFLLHRVITDVPAGIQIDHRNCDRLDNRRLNLRNCTPTQNARNRTVHNNRCGFKGVYRNDDKKKKWRARIKVNQKPIHLGYFVNIQDAAKAYDDAAATLFGEFARVA